MKCPLCGSEKGHRIYRLCDNMKIMGRHFPESAAFVAGCENCGLLYTDMEATQEDLLTYYRSGAVAPGYYDMFGKDATEDYYQHLLDLMEPYIRFDSCLLDIAGSWGEYAAYMKSQGYEDITVLDPNENCIAKAEKAGVKTKLADSIHMDEIESGSIDLVILNHSLEHILDVKSTMENIKRVLKDDGTLFVEVPDVMGYTDEEAAPFNFLTYEHVLHMSMNDMENLANAYGFEILDKGDYYKKVSNYPSIYALMKKGRGKGLVYSGGSEKAMLSYLEKSKEEIGRFVERFRISGEPLILWGIGASTAILMGSFEGCNVTALIDRNPNRQGLSFHINGKDHPIQPPEAVGDGTIVILSIPYHDPIERQIRQMGFHNKIVALKQGR